MTTFNAKIKEELITIIMKTFLQSHILILVFFFVFSYPTFAANPSQPFLPSDNVQDPNCTPLDSNCYVSTVSATTTLQQGGNSFGTTLTLGTNDNQALSFETNGASAMTILGNGNVGIGTVAPEAKLDIRGDLKVGTSSNSIFYVDTSNRRIGVDVANPALAYMSFGAAPPSGYVMKFAPIGTHASSSYFNMTHNATTFDVGKAPDEVMMWGYNIAPGGGRENFGETAIGLSMEGSYNTGGAEYTEAHLLYVDKQNNQFRPWSWRINKNNTSDIAALLQGSSFSVTNTADLDNQYFSATPSGITIQTTGAKASGRSVQLMDDGFNVILQRNGGTNSGDFIMQTGWRNVSFPGATLSVGGNIFPTSLAITGNNNPLTLSDNSSIEKIRIRPGTGVTLASDRGFVFTSGASSASVDTGLYRNSGGVLEINNGSVGQHRDLQLRSLNPVSGNIGIGTTTPADKLQVFGDIRVGTTGTNGCIKDFGGTGITGTCSSDERLKTNVVDLSDGYLDKMNNLRLITYNWNEQANSLNKVDTTNTNYGLLAQNVESIFPELVTVDSNGFKQVNYSRLPLYLLKAVQELTKKFDKIATWFGGDSFNVQNDVCVDDYCITKSQFKQMLINSQNGQPVTQSSYTPSVVNVPVNTSEPVIEQATTTTPEVIPDPVVQPTPIPTPEVVVVEVVTE